MLNQGSQVLQRVILVKGGNDIGIRVSTPQEGVRVARYLLRVARYLVRVAICFCQILQQVILDGKGKRHWDQSFDSPG